MKHTFADLLPPDILDSARPHAVDTLTLISANDEVAQVTTLFNQEGGVTRATLGLATALGATAESLHSAIEGLASSDGLGLLKGHGSRGRGKREAEALLEVVGARKGGCEEGEEKGGSGRSCGEMHDCEI